MKNVFGKTVKQDKEKGSYLLLREIVSGLES